jgi:hypothetical protein
LDLSSLIDKICGRSLDQENKTTNISNKQKGFKLGWLSLGLLILCFTNLLLAEVFIGFCLRSADSVAICRPVPSGIFAYREKVKWIRKCLSSMPIEAQRFGATALFLDKAQVVLVICTIAFVVFAGWKS